VRFPSKLIVPDALTPGCTHSWVSGVNAFLPSSISVRWATQILDFDPEAQNGFHARFSAVSRTYHYVIFTDPVRSPLWEGRAGWVFRTLEHERMQEAANLLLGEHDFTAFRAAGCQAKSPVKEMYAAKILKKDKLIVCSFKANAFLHHMVRNIVGSLIFIGTGRRDPNWISELLEHRDRSQAAPTFMADGLYLAKVSYDETWRLPQVISEGLFGLNVDFS
jgi:tRNA pseudouridine38-40 synthase